jgi:hypothetical protein
MGEKRAMPLRTSPFSKREDKGIVAFRFYFRLLKTRIFLDFEVVLSGEKWSEVDQSGSTPAQSSPSGLLVERCYRCCDFAETHRPQWMRRDA